MSVEQWAPLVDEVVGLWSKLTRPWLRPALLATISVESSGNARASGAAGEIGLTQILPATAIALGWEPGQLWDPRENLEASKKLLIELWGQLGPDVDAVASAYNCGAERRGGGFASRCYRGPRTAFINQVYVDRWLGQFQRWGGTLGSYAAQSGPLPFVGPPEPPPFVGPPEPEPLPRVEQSVTVRAPGLAVAPAPASWLLLGVVVVGALVGAVWASGD